MKTYIHNLQMCKHDSICKKQNIYFQSWNNIVETAKYPHESILINNDVLWRNAWLTSHSVMSRIVITNLRHEALGCM